MLFSKLQILKSHGKQAIPDLRRVELTPLFRGRPKISAQVSAMVMEELAAQCPSGAIGTAPFSIDLGRCIFCKACELNHPEAIHFTNDYHIGSTSRKELVVTAQKNTIDFHFENVRPEIPNLFSEALKLRVVSAGGDNATEMELNASANVNFDFGRFGVNFVASPRHADGLVIVGPISRNMAIPLEICYNAIPEPKLIILAGTDAVSGGLFAETAALDRSFLNRHTPDLYLPGNPVHPLTFIDATLNLLHKKMP